MLSKGVGRIKFYSQYMAYRKSFHKTSGVILKKNYNAYSNFNVGTWNQGQRTIIMNACQDFMEGYD